MPALKSDIPYVVDAETGCWEWQQGRISTGYGEMWLGQKVVLAHRVYYEQHVGPIPPGMQIDHLCRNRSCVNPAHLEPVTNAENSRRGDRTKLDWEKVRFIRRRVDLAPAELAPRFGVARCTISNIRAGRSWVAE